MSLLLADIVAKVFLGWRTKILRAADAFYARRREGPYRFIQNRSQISVVALKSDAAAEKPKDQLSRDFLGCSVFRLLQQNQSKAVLTANFCCTLFSIAYVQTTACDVRFLPESGHSGRALAVSQ